MTSPTREHVPKVLMEAFARHKSLHLPLGYKFSPTDEEMLAILESFNQQTPDANWPSTIPTFPMHHITDIYSFAPDDITRHYEKGNHESWFFLSLQRFEPTSSLDRVLSGNGGYWRKKGSAKKVKNGQQVLGNIRNEEFYYSGNQEKTGWNIEQFSLVNRSKKLTPQANKVEYVISRVYYKGTFIPEHQTAHHDPQPAKGQIAHHNPQPAKGQIAHHEPPAKRPYAPGHQTAVFRPDHQYAPAHSVPQHPSPLHQTAHPGQQQPAKRPYAPGHQTAVFRPEHQYAPAHSVPQHPSPHHQTAHFTPGQQQQPAMRQSAPAHFAPPHPSLLHQTAPFAPEQQQQPAMRQSAPAYCAPRHPSLLHQTAPFAPEQQQQRQNAPQYVPRQPQHTMLPQPALPDNQWADEYFNSHQIGYSGNPVPQQTSGQAALPDNQWADELFNPHQTGEAAMLPPHPAALPDNQWADELFNSDQIDYPGNLVPQQIMLPPTHPAALPDDQLAAELYNSLVD